MYPPSAQKRLAQQNDVAMTSKRVRNNHAMASAYNAPAAQRRSVRIFARRYALTKTEHKYLEIGLNVGPPSYVEIAIGDKWGNEVKLSPEVWNGIYNQKAQIEEYFSKGVTGMDPIYIGPMLVTFTKFKSEKCICLDLNNVRILMMAPTVERLFALTNCIEHMHNWLATCINVVDEKFHQFSALTYSITNHKDAIACIERSEFYDKNHPFDCELLAIAF